MPEVSYERSREPVSSPAALGEIGVVGTTLAYHNGTSVATIYSTLNPPPSGASSTVTSITTATTAANNTIYLANGTFTVTLPAAAANAQVTVKNTGTGVITIAGTIDGSTTTTLVQQYQSITVVSDGSAWFGI